MFQSPLWAKTWILRESTAGGTVAWWLPRSFHWQDSFHWSRRDSCTCREYLICRLCSKLLLGYSLLSLLCNVQFNTSVLWLFLLCNRICLPFLFCPMNCYNKGDCGATDYHKQLQCWKNSVVVKAQTKLMLNLDCKDYVLYYLHSGIP